MSKIQWEYDLVEKPFCQQLQAMGWEWLEGDRDVPELTHLKQRNHGPEFWRLLEAALPDWRERKAKIDSDANGYLMFDPRRKTG